MQSEAISINWLQGDRFEYLCETWVFIGCIGGHTMSVRRDREPFDEQFFSVKDAKEWRKLAR